MRETETFEYIRRKYPDKEETWRKVTQLVKFDENLEVKSVHDFNMECYISSAASSYSLMSLSDGISIVELQNTV